MLADNKRSIGAPEPLLPSAHPDVAAMLAAVVADEEIAWATLQRNGQRPAPDDERLTAVEAWLAGEGRGPTNQAAFEVLKLGAAIRRTLAVPLAAPDQWATALSSVAEMCLELGRLKVVMQHAAEFADIARYRAARAAGARKANESRSGWQLDAIRLIARRAELDPSLKCKKLVGDVVDEVNERRDQQGRPRVKEAALKKALSVRARFGTDRTLSKYLKSLRSLGT